MSEVTKINPQILDAITVTQQATLSGNTVDDSGAGKAYQSVAQSTAIAVQDATDQLRNLSTIGTTAIGVAMAQMVATGDVDKYAAVINQAQQMMSSEASNFKLVGESAAEVLKSFPSGR